MKECNQYFKHQYGDLFIDERFHMVKIRECKVELSKIDDILPAGKVLVMITDLKVM